MKKLLALLLLLAIGSPCWAQTYESLLTDPDLIARWNGDANDDGTGDADDLIGAADGTWSGTATYTDPPTDKGAGKAFVFDGSSDIDCGDVAPYPNGTDFSVSFWIREASFSTTNEYFVAQSSGFEVGWAMRDNQTVSGAATNVGGSAVSGFCGDHSTAAGIATTAARSAATWHFVTLEYDFSAGTARVSVDGSFGSATTVDTETQATNLSIGSRNGTLPCTADIYDVRVWDRVLTAGDITALMAGPSSGDPNPLTPTLPGGTPDPLRRIIQ